MKEIHEYIRKETKALKRRSSHLFNLVNNTVLIRKVSEDYNIWLCDLNKLISNKLYRQALKEIEKNKYKFELIKNQFWKYRFIKAKAILKIIKLKMNKHQKEIIIENSKQNFSLKFWFNQMFIVLEELILEFRFDLNKHINYKSKKIIEPILTLIEYHLEFIYYLCIFFLSSNDVIPLLAYLSITDKFLPYIPFMSKKKLLHLFQNIILLKIKILIENCEFLASFENIKIVFRLCFREMLLYLDYDSKIYLNSLNVKNKKENEVIFGFCRIIQNITLAYFLRGVACEHLGFFKLSIHSYKQCRWFSKNFLYYYNKELFNFFKNIKKKYIIFKEIFDDIHNQILVKNKIKNKQNIETIFIKKCKIDSYRTYRNSEANNIRNNYYYNTSLNKSEIKLRPSSNSFIKKREKLVSLLEDIGNNLYKEEEYRNNSIFKKFTVNSFVLSTVNMINNLLSNPFNHILKKMDKVELTKPKDEISHLINWTLNYKRQKEFKNQIESLKNKRLYSNKINNKNNSYIRLSNIKNRKCFDLKMNSQIKLLKNYEISKNNEINSNEKSNNNNNNNIISINNNTKDKLNVSENLVKLKIHPSKSQNKSKKNYIKISKKIEKYPLNKNVFSKSLLNKKNYLDSFYEKELNFQKGLLKLKGSDVEKTYNNYNQQQAINSAEQEFKILQCTAESKNKKNNLMNLIKNVDEYHKIKLKLPDKQLRELSNKKKILKKKQLSKIINNNNVSLNSIYDPNDVSKYNEEKSKILNMECAELELMEQKFQIQRKNLMNKIKMKKEF